MKSLETVKVLLVVAASLVVAAPNVGLGASYCEGDKPISVLKCYSAACADRDSVAYGALFAPEYVGVNVSDSTMAEVDYRTHVSKVASMFRAPEVKSLMMEFGTPKAVEPGPTADTWIVRDVPSTLHMEATVAGGKAEPFAVTAVMSFWVRRVTEPAPHYVIFRDEQRTWDGK